MLEPLTPAAIETIISGLGAPWTEAGSAEIAAAAANANGSVREALQRLEPAGKRIGAMIDARGRPIAAR